MTARIHHVDHAAADLGDENWRRPWSGPNGASCVEAKKLPGGRIALRQSSDPHGPALVCTTEEMRVFIQWAKDGGADFLIS